MSRAVLLASGLCMSGFAAVTGLSAVLSGTVVRPGSGESAAERAPARVNGRGAAAGDVVDASLHAAHVRGVEPVACARCHRIRAGTYAVPDRARCLECHPSRATGVHAAVAATSAPVCTQCHDFLARGDPRERAWQCGSCHARPHGQALAARSGLSATCGRCHRPHAEQPMAAVACISCHPAQATQHRASGDGAMRDCLTCHRQHDAARLAQDRCAPCHQTRGPHVPATATFAGGHDRCTGCHRPHSFARRDAMACTSCHQGKPVLASERVRAHADCKSCHQVHDVKAASAKSCRRCHDDVAAVHPPGARGDACTGCHPPHAAREAPRMAARACSSCHTAAKSDRAFHRGARCTDCHRQHGFAIRFEPDLCLRCHASRQGAAAPVEPNAGHRDCARCHGANPHAPAKPAACRTCHGEEARTVPAGHAECAKCHQQHSGQLRPRAAACTGCHTDRAAGPHAGIPGGCANCHRPHGPGRVASPPPCATCHRKGSLPGLHSASGHQTCTACHRSHVPPTAEPAVCLRCHTDRRDHEPGAKSCASCHPFRSEPQ